MRPLGPDAHDGAARGRWGEGWVGYRWDEVAFLWAESFFYRRLLDAVDFFAPGPWFWLDPFAHQKDAELADPALAAELAALDQLADLDAAGSEKKAREHGRMELIDGNRLVWLTKEHLGKDVLIGPPS